MKYLSPKQVSEIVGCFENAVWTAIRYGELSHCKIGKSTVIEESDMHKWVESRKVIKEADNGTK